jgi:mannan endo-1,4-beta-mannosidase
LTDTQRLGRHRQAPPEESRLAKGHHRTRLAAIVITAVVAVIIVVSSMLYIAGGPTRAHPASQGSRLPAAADSVIGVYTHDSPESYAGVTTFTTTTGVKPNIVVYYSGWLETFRAAFAATASREGAVPLIQMNPTHASVAAIASGKYDAYLKTYAEAVRAYGHPVILSFGHEMNGSWYTWGYKHTSPVTFVAAWQHIVNVFREQKVRNVTWLWTINTIHKQNGVPAPGPWWPGSSYVNLIGIDGYYTSPSSVFASVFGPTIVYVRTLTHDPILITETSVTPAADQPAKIANLFAGIRLYGLRGFVWFDSVDKVDWRLSTPAAIAAFRHYAETYRSDAS